MTFSIIIITFCYNNPNIHEKIIIDRHFFKNIEIDLEHINITVNMKKAAGNTNL